MISCPQLLDRHHIIGTRAFLTLPYLELNLLTFIQRRIAAATLNLRIVDKEVFASVLWRDKSETLSGAEPLDLTFTHLFSLELTVNQHKISTSKFTGLKQKTKI